MGDHSQLKAIIFTLLSGGEISLLQKNILDALGEEWEQKTVLYRIPLTYSPCINNDCDSLGEIRLSTSSEYYIDCTTCKSISPITNEERYGWKASIGLFLSLLLKDTITFSQVESWQGLESTWKLGTRLGMTILFSTQKQPHTNTNNILTITLDRESTGSLFLFDFVHISEDTFTIDTDTLDSRIALINGLVLMDTALTISYGLWRVAYTTPTHETISSIYYGDVEIYSLQTNNKKVRANDWKALASMIEVKGALCTYQIFYKSLFGDDYDPTSNQQRDEIQRAKNRLCSNPILKQKIQVNRNQGYILKE